MPSPLLQATLNAGAELRRAIEAADFAQVEALAAARGALVDRLLAETTPAMYTEPEVEALSAQHRVLAGLLATHEETMRDALAALTRRRQAHTSYDAPPARTSVLRTVRG